MPTTNEGKPIAWAMVELVEQSNGNIEMYVAYVGGNREGVSQRNPGSNVHIRFSKRTGASGKQAHRKLAR